MLWGSFYRAWISIGANFCKNRSSRFLYIRHFYWWGFSFSCENELSQIEDIAGLFFRNQISIIEFCREIRLSIFRFITSNIFSILTYQIEISCFQDLSTSFLRSLVRLGNMLRDNHLSGFWDYRNHQNHMLGKKVIDFWIQYTLSPTI